MQAAIPYIQVDISYNISFRWWLEPSPFDLPYMEYSDVIYHSDQHFKLNLETTLV